MDTAHLSLIKKIAWNYHASTGLDFDDLFSAASLAYVRAVATYDETKGASLNTWIWRAMENQLRNELKSVRKHRAVSATIASIAEESSVGWPQGALQLKALLEYEHDVDAMDPETLYSFKERLDKLSDRAKALCAMIFENPGDFLGETKKESKHTLRIVLQEKGWSQSQIWDSFREVKQFVREG
jgi:RNA polymerase sigma factor (sigma-70 family)